MDGSYDFFRSLSISSVENGQFAFPVEDSQQFNDALDENSSLLHRLSEDMTTSFDFAHSSRDSMTQLWSVQDQGETNNDSLPVRSESDSFPPSKSRQVVSDASEKSWASSIRPGLHESTYPGVPVEVEISDEEHQRRLAQFHNQKRIQTETTEKDLSSFSSQQSLGQDADVQNDTVVFSRRLSTISEPGQWATVFQHLFVEFCFCFCFCYISSCIYLYFPERR